MSAINLTPQAQGHQTDIRSSFDDSHTPLLQDDHEAGIRRSSSGIQFDLEYVFFHYIGNGF